MTLAGDQILVVPRSLLESQHWFTPWMKLGATLSRLQRATGWCVREEAEAAADWVQPIPCAVIRNSEGQYCVLRRIKETRSDLRSKISLLVGGHVHRLSTEKSLSEMLIDTLRRELEEEVGLPAPDVVQPIGLVIDSTSMLTSRHAAFVFEVAAAKADMKTLAHEEFSRRSKFNLQFFSARKLQRFHSEFDPWSRLIYEEYISPRGNRKKPRQFEMRPVS